MTEVGFTPERKTLLLPIQFLKEIELSVQIMSFHMEAEPLKLAQIRCGFIVPVFPTTWQSMVAEEASLRVAISLKLANLLSNKI